MRVIMSNDVDWSSILWMYQQDQYISIHFAVAPKKSSPTCCSIHRQLGEQQGTECWQHQNLDGKKSFLVAPFPTHIKGKADAHQQGLQNGCQQHRHQTWTPQCSSSRPFIGKSAKLLQQINLKFQGQNSEEIWKSTNSSNERWSSLKSVNCQVEYVP